MHLILLSGGSGKRLWPLSNGVQSKQFLRLLKSPTGETESMVQRIYRQISDVGNWDSITIATAASQIEQIKLQLGDKVNVVIEPERRDTFPAIMLSCAYLASEIKVNSNEAIAVLPVDSFVETDFFIRVQEMEAELSCCDAELMLIGALPVIPSEKYGYVIPERIDKNSQRRSNRVGYFKEKPTTAMAEELISKGALWNCGVFGFKLGYIEKIAEEVCNIKPFDFSIVQGKFDKMKKVSFDYEVSEKEKNVRVIEYGKKWKDLGTWETFTEEIEKCGTGESIINCDCENTHIINQLPLPLITIGIKDAVIITSHDGILVANKGQTTQLKDVVSDINTRPMYEERRWGKYIVLEHIFYDNCEVLTKRLIIKQGGQISYQYHNMRQEIWTVISGKGMLFYCGEKKEVNAGDIIKIDKKEKHGIRALTKLEIIEVQMGTQLIEEDIVRIETNWE